MFCGIVRSIVHKTISRYIIYSKSDQSNIVYHSRMPGMIADPMQSH